MKLLTRQNVKDLPPLYSNENKPAGEHLAVVKFFNPVGSGTWYATEFDGDDIFFGLVTGLAEDELGYFSLTELASYRGRFGIGIERDLHFKPITLKEIKPDMFGD